MKQGLYEIIENKPLTSTTYRMILRGDTSEISAAGQFVNIKLEKHFLRRPISVCDAEGDLLTLIYKILGKGTKDMSKISRGTVLDILTGLGNGYDLSCAGDRPLLVGGGVGIPPLYLAARKLLAEDREVTAVLGYNSAEEIYYADEFKSLGCNVLVATADGSVGTEGMVTDALKETDLNFTHFYTCGPLPMLRAVHWDIYTMAGIAGQLSLEERMGCGFGACMGCSIIMKDGYKRVCKDGPVFKAEEMLW